MNKVLFANAILVAALSSGAVMAGGGGGGGSGSGGAGHGGMQGGGQMTQQKGSPSVNQSSGSSWKYQEQNQEQNRMRLEQHDSAKQMEGDHDALKIQTQDRQQFQYDLGSQK